MHRRVTGVRKLFFISAQIIKMSQRNIAGDALRSFFTCLGIIIGTFSLIFMMSVMDIRMEKKKKEIDEEGYGAISFDLVEGTMPRGFLDSQLEHIRSMDGIKGLNPNLELKENTSIKVGQKLCRDVSAVGVSEEWCLYAGDIKMLYGEGFDSQDLAQERRVCIVSKKLAEKLFGTSECVGKKINVLGIEFEIVGVYKLYGSEGEREVSVKLPYTLFRKMTGIGIYGFTVYPESHEILGAVDTAVVEYLSDITHTDKYKGFYSSYSEYFIEDMEEEVKKSMFLQIVVAAISLLIGGIGIMNMMLVSVSERTAEIGLRKALGSSEKRIQFQFVIEALMLSFTGGLIGVLGGVLFSALYCLIAEGRAHVNFTSAIVGLLFSMAVGGFFGWSPAKAASRLSPIEALKGE